MAEPEDRVTEAARLAQHGLRDGAEQVRRRLQDTSRGLRAERREIEAQAVDQAAAGAERVGSWLHEMRAEDIVARLGAAGRRQPLLFAAAGAALGLAAARALGAAGREPEPPEPEAEDPRELPPGG